LDVLNDEPRDGARYIIAAHSLETGLGSLDSSILRETSIAGVIAYERMGLCTVGVNLDENWSDMSSEEVAGRFSAYDWGRKVITLC
jgi:hypothetical protein